MKKLLAVLALSFAFFSCTGVSVSPIRPTRPMPTDGVATGGYGGVREIPKHSLRDAAVATHDRRGPVIYYNPYILRKLGPGVSNFVRAHEYGHHALNHFQREKGLRGKYSSAQIHHNFEKEADCFAAKKVKRSDNLAAIRYFASRGGSSNSKHPSGYDRANVIRECGL